MREEKSGRGNFFSGYKTHHSGTKGAVLGAICFKKAARGSPPVCFHIPENRSLERSIRRCFCFGINLLVNGLKGPGEIKPQPCIFQGRTWSDQKGSLILIIYFYLLTIFVTFIYLFILVWKEIPVAFEKGAETNASLFLIGIFNSDNMFSR